MAGNGTLASQIPELPTVEICQNETQVQPIEEGASLFDCTISEQAEITCSIPRARPMQSQQKSSDALYKAEKRKLKLERM